MADGIVTWRLHKKGVILLVAGCVLISLMTFVAGYILGNRRVARPPAAPAKKVAPKPAPAKATASPAEPQDLALRVGLFTAEEDAKALVAQLATAKLEATVIPMPVREVA